MDIMRFGGCSKNGVVKGNRDKFTMGLDQLFGSNLIQGSLEVE